MERTPPDISISPSRTSCTVPTSMSGIRELVLIRWRKA
jgi:hypothetical protein